MVLHSKYKAKSLVPALKEPSDFAIFFKRRFTIPQPFHQRRTNTAKP
jgi:hypothetical protein